MCLGMQLPVSTAVYMLLQDGGLRRPLPDFVWNTTSTRGLSGRGICEGSMRLLAEEGEVAGEPA